MTVGSASDSVTITADAAPLETLRASAGQSITAHEIENLPLDGHTALDAEYLGFGVISQENRDANSPSGNAGFATITMGGAAQGANEILLDGVPDIGTQGTTGRRLALSAAARLGCRSEDGDFQYGRLVRRRWWRHRSK